MARGEPAARQLTAGAPWRRFALAFTVLIAISSSSGAQQPAEQSSEATAESGRIERLIEQLGAEDFYDREQAEEQLREMGFRAYDPLLAAHHHPDLEVAARVGRLLNLLEVAWTQSNDPPVLKKFFHDYAILTETKRWDRVESADELPPRERLAALSRILLHERSTPLSFRAALGLIELLDQHGPTDRGKATNNAGGAGGAVGNAGTDSPGRLSAELLAQLREQFEGRRRPGVELVDQWFESGGDKRTMVDLLSAEIDRQRALVQESSAKSSRALIASMLRLQARWLGDLGRPARAAIAMREMLQWEQARPEDIGALLDWLIEQQAWSIIGEVHDRFGQEIDGRAELLYRVAEARRAAGDGAAADRLAGEAFALNQSTPETLSDRMELAQALWTRGLFDWAEREFEALFDQPGLDSGVAVLLAQQYAELLHDRGRDRQAAEVIEQALAQLDDPPMNARNPVTRARLEAQIAPIRARMHYFRACDHARENRPAQQRAELKKALEVDGDELDALIACYRLSDESSDFRRETLARIEKAADSLERLIRQAPDNPTSYNQYAWLIGNTEGDLDKALRYSRKSLELEPGSGGYLDTLAHVYFARGEYAKAVETQRRAVELEPHSKLIADQYEVFRAALRDQGEKTE